MNFTKFSRTPFSTKHLWWLLLLAVNRKQVPQLAFSEVQVKPFNQILKELQVKYTDRDDRREDMHKIQCFWF